MMDDNRDPRRDPRAPDRISPDAVARDAAPRRFPVTLPSELLARHGLNPWRQHPAPEPIPGRIS